MRWRCKFLLQLQYCKYDNTFLKCSRTVRDLRIKVKKSNIEDVAWTRLPPEGRSTGVCYSFQFMKATTNSFLGSRRVSHRAPPLTKHTQDTINNRYTYDCAVCAQHKCVSRVSFYFRRWRMRQVPRSSRQRPSPPTLTASWTHLATDPPQPSAVAFGRLVALHPVMTRVV